MLFKNIGPWFIGEVAERSIPPSSFLHSFVQLSSAPEIQMQS